MLSQTSYYWHVPQLLVVKINGLGHHLIEIEMKINETKTVEMIGDMIERKSVWKIYGEWIVIIRNSIFFLWKARRHYPWLMMDFELCRRCSELKPLLTYLSNDFVIIKQPRYKKHTLRKTEAKSKICWIF